MTMEIKHQIDDSKGMFYIDENGSRLAEMTYSKSGTSHLVIIHTHVSPVLKGQGVGRQLVHAAVEYARAQHIKILPRCSFAKGVIDKTPEYADVLLHQ